MLVAVVLAGAAGLVLGARGVAPSRVAPGGPPHPAQGIPRTAATPVRACLLAAVTVVLVVPSVPGAAAAAAILWWGPGTLRRLEPRVARADRERLARDLPMAMDLLAACLAAGADPARAAAAVGAAVGGPCGGRFAAVAGALRAGSPAELAWAGLTRPSAVGDDPLAPVARLLARAAVGGAPVSATVARLASDLRGQQRANAQQAARRVGVLAVAPLGLCFLPAFVLLGVVPVVVGLAAPLLGAGR